MREIIFRGLTEEGQWLFGNLIECQGLQSILDIDKTLHTPIDLLGTEIIRSKVREETIGQYTGLNDKNGIPIYEGDILRCFEEVPDMECIEGVRTEEYIKPLPVIYDSNHCQFMAEDRELKSLYDIWLDFEYVVVIGNIYDNKNLLEE